MQVTKSQKTSVSGSQPVIDKATTLVINDDIAKAEAMSNSMDDEADSQYFPMYKERLENAFKDQLDNGQVKTILILVYPSDYRQRNNLACALSNFIEGLEEEGVEKNIQVVIDDKLSYSEQVKWADELRSYGIGIAKTVPPLKYLAAQKTGNYLYSQIAQFPKELRDRIVGGMKEAHRNAEHNSNRGFVIQQKDLNNNNNNNNNNSFVVRNQI